jgi:steroid delta-isomerase-like uncharacterized protein
MHVRMNMLAGDPGQLGEAIRYFEATVRPHVEGQVGSRGLAVFTDADLGTCVVASYWDSADTMTVSEQAVESSRKEFTELIKGTATVEHYEVPIYVRRGGSAPGADIGLTRMDGSPACLDAAIEEFRNTAVPELMDTPGICSVQLMADRASGRCIVVTAWEDKDALAGSRSSGARLRADISAVAHVTIRSVEEYGLAFTSVREGDTRGLIERNIELWNARDHDGWLAAADLYRMELEAPGGQRLVGRDAAETLWSTWNEAFPDLRIDTVSVHADDRGGALEGRFIGTHKGMLHRPAGDVPATGRSLSMRFCGIYEFDEGKVVSFHLYFDKAEMLAQLGMMPEITGSRR